LLRLGEAASARGGEEGRLLVGVLPVPQGVGQGPRLAAPRGQCGVVEALAEPRRHGDVVGRGVPERAHGEAAALVVAEAAGTGGLDDATVVRRVDDDGDGAVVLRRGPHHGGPADVDLLDALGDAGAGGHRLAEGVEVHHDEIERLDPEAAEFRHVPGVGAVGQDAGVDRRVEGLDAAVEALGEPGEVGDLRDGHPGGGDGGRRGAGGDEGHPRLVEAGGQIGEAGLVVDGDECAADHRRAPLSGGTSTQAGDARSDGGPLPGGWSTCASHGRGQSTART